MTALLQVEGLDKRFYATHAVREASFTVEAGEIVALLGENGAGKSTVIKMLAGVYRPDAGRILLEGRDVSDPAVRRKMSFIHQNLGLIEWMTVAENIALTLGFPRRGGVVSTKEVRAQAERVLDTIGGGIDPDTRIFDLPRTERSLLAIARGLVSDPRLLVLDEPTASLPQADVDRVFTVLRRLRDAGVGMIYVSHRLDEIYQIALRTVMMRNGAVVAERDVSGLSHEELIDLIVGHEANDVRFDPPSGQVRLRLDAAITGGVGPVDAEIRAGEIVALCGLRGSGQESLGRALAGAIPFTSGAVSLDDVPFLPTSPTDAVTRGVGFATSNREAEAVAPGLTVRENLFINPRVWGRRAWRFLSRREESVRAEEITNRFGVRPADPELALDTFSGGNQQKVILARWFGVGRRLVVLEEPTMGVDVGAKSDIYAILGDAAASGTTAIIVSTDMEEVAKIAHRALVFGRGRVVAELSGDDVTIAHLVAAASDLDRAEEVAS